MKDNIIQKRAYVLLPDLIKQAMLKQQDKQNININGNKIPNQKILLSKYLEVNSLKNTYKLKNSTEKFDTQLQTTSPQVSFKSEGIWNQRDQRNQLNQMKKTYDIKNKNQQRKSMDFRKQKRKNSMIEKSNIIVNKDSKKISAKNKQKQERSAGKNSESKKSGLITKVLKDIKQQKIQKSLLQNQGSSLVSCNTSASKTTTEKQDFRFIRSVDNSNRQQIQPIMNIIQNMVGNDRMSFDQQKFKIFLQNLRDNRQFKKSLKAFTYSYFLQNELKD